MRVDTKEKHKPCPYRNTCTGTGFCHKWKVQATAREFNTATVYTIYHDCDRIGHGMRKGMV